MKLKNKLSIITLASMLAFAGVGFAAWTFNNNEAQSKNASTYVTSALNAKNVVLSGNTEVYLVLDESKPYWSTSVNNGSKPVELEGGKITVAPKYDLQNQNDGASWTYTLTSEIEIDSIIASYVNVTGFDTTNKTGTILANGGENQIESVDYALPTLAYTSNKPSTYEDYQAMLSAVEGKVITFTFNCTFVED